MEQAPPARTLESRLTRFAHGIAKGRPRLSVVVWPPTRVNRLFVTVTRPAEFGCAARCCRNNLPAGRVSAIVPRNRADGESFRPRICWGEDSECDLMRDHETGGGRVPKIRPPLLFARALTTREGAPRFNVAVRCRVALAEVGEPARAGADSLPRLVRTHGGQAQDGRRHCLSTSPRSD